MFLLLGLGYGNLSIKKYLDKYDIKYCIYDDLKSKYSNLNNINLNEINCVVKSSGISNEHFLIKYFKNNNIEVITDLSFYYRFRKYNNFTALITGSNGKSSTVMLIKHLIGDCIVAGNIGDPICNYLEVNKPIIIEVSSYMAEYCFNSKANIIGFINLYPNHLRHHHTYNQYIASKCNLIDKNNKDLLVFINSKDYKYFNNYNVIFYDVLNKYLNVEFLYLDNALLAIFIALNFGVSINEIYKKIKTFKYLEHRLELFLKYKNIEFINDSKSTNFLALNCAIKKYINNNVLLIVGGKIKEEDLFLDYKDNLKIVLINGENRFILKDFFDKLKIKNYVFNNLNDLIDKLDDFLFKIDIVLFSPGSESFDQFDNFEMRGKIYKEMILNKYQSVV